MICVHFIAHFKSRVGIKVEEWCFLMNGVQSQDVDTLGGEDEFDRDQVYKGTTLLFR